IVALDTPRALLDSLGTEIVELRLEADVDAVLSFLQAQGAAGGDSFTVGSTLTVPLRGGSSRQVIDAVADFGAAVTATSTRPPTLDDVYLRLTGNRLAA
ncbi:MAG TPA: hypothetical protein VKX24_03760, partial [Acidimicrobiia bacterium]|nr:hypothetical protein [Acidimicrobiia bacterium]